MNLHFSHESLLRKLSYISITLPLSTSFIIYSKNSNPFVRHDLLFTLDEIYCFQSLRALLDIFFYKTVRQVSVIHLFHYNNYSSVFSSNLHTIWAKKKSIASSNSNSTQYSIWMWSFVNLWAAGCLNDNCNANQCFCHELYTIHRQFWYLLWRTTLLYSKTFCETRFHPWSPLLKCLLILQRTWSLRQSLSMLDSFLLFNISL